MPQLDGMRLLRKLNRSGMLVVFVTAYEQYALSAFELNAADYLLKPFDPDRFAAAVDRVRQMISQSRQAEENARGPGAAQPADIRPPRPDYIPVRSGPDIILVRTGSIDWIEAKGNYVRLHVGKQTHMLRESMQNFEVLLDPAVFARVHRSTIVNVERIDRMRPMYHGEFEIVLKDGTVVLMSRSYQDRMRERWGRWI
jgi:two-component system LytT family response regulator